MTDLLLHNLSEVATPEGTVPLRGADQRRVRRIPGAEVLCRDGREVAEIRRRAKRRPTRDLTPDPRFQVEPAPGYGPSEPLTEDEWPETLR